MDQTLASYLWIVYKKFGHQVASTIFDEIGLADIGLDNPLKALHSYLDNASEDKSEELRTLLVQMMDSCHDFESLSEKEKESLVLSVQLEKAAFIGVSNWRLDASKTNRTIFIARGNLSEGQLFETSLAIFNSYSEKCGLGISLTAEDKNAQEKYIKELFHKICKSYEYFRTMLADCDQNQEESDYGKYKNMHGSRDFYQLVSFITYSITPELLSVSEDLQQTLVEIALQGIERNFQGSKISLCTFKKGFKENIDFRFVNQIDAYAIPKTIECIKANLLKRNFTAHPSSGTSPDREINRAIKIPPPRHMLIITSGSFIDTWIVSYIVEIFEVAHKRVKMVSNAL